MSLDDTNKVVAGGRVLISTTITDAKTGLPPSPLPDIVTCIIYKPDVAGYVAVDAGQVMTHDTGGDYFLSYLTPSDGPEGSWKTQIAIHFADSSTDLALRQSTFWVVLDD